MTLLRALAAWAERRPSDPSIVLPERTITHDELYRAILAGAAFLHRAGVEAGDRVVLQAPNSLELAVAYFAVHAARAVAVPLDVEASDKTFAAILRSSGARLVVSVRSPDGVATVTPDQVARATTVMTLPEPALDDPADLLYTTGTTGEPKGVLLSHRNVAAIAANISAITQQRPDDVEAVPVPFSHSFGLGRLRSKAVAGNALLPLDGLRDVKATIHALRSNRVTGLALVPAGFAFLRRAAAKSFPIVAAELRYIEVASATMAPDVRAWLLAAAPRARIVHTYGLTEASRAAFVDLRSPLVERGSIGHASPDVEIRVRRDDGEPAVTGEGELVIRGPIVMVGYWQEPEQTGWFRTGDVGVIDDDGALHLRARLRDLINVGGLKVAPGEVEELVAGYPGVLDVACAAIADPQRISGERVKVFVVANERIDQVALADWLRARGLESYKIPVAVEEVAAIPRTASGKILRHLLG